MEECEEFSFNVAAFELALRGLHADVGITSNNSPPTFSCLSALGLSKNDLCPRIERVDERLNGERNAGLSVSAESNRLLLFLPT